jgi:hypothetical protein
MLNNSSPVLEEQASIFLLESVNHDYMQIYREFVISFLSQCKAIYKP